MPRRYPPEFRRKVLDLLKAGRSVAQIASDLQISDQTIYVWRRQELIDTGQVPGITSGDQQELTAARRRIAELELELAAHRRAAELLKEVMPPKVGYAAVKTMVAEGIPITVGCRVVGVSESGYYAWRDRPAAPRSIRHAWLTDMIRDIHTASRGTYGSRRVHAELRLGRGIVVGHGAIELLMHRAGIVGLPGSRRRRPKPETPYPGDLVDRQFTRTGPNQLWVTDITEHPTREGKVYCAVVLDVYSRRVVGWSIDSTQTAQLVTNALGMALTNRHPDRGTIIHSDSPIRELDLHPPCPGSRPGPVDGVDRRLLRQRPDGSLLGPNADRTARSAPLADPHRAGKRDLRVPGDLPQPATPPQLAGLPQPHRIRENPPVHPARRLNQPRRLHTSRGTSKSPNYRDALIEVKVYGVLGSRS